MNLDVQKYSDQFMDWLKEFGYTHCFYLGGGNVMHLLESASHRFECVPFVHEVGAGIAADYFNEVSDSEKAFVLVTAGPALTNLVTAIAGAWTESRELLVIGGQAKVSDLSRGKYRQIGFQELDGQTICKSITKASVTIDQRISKQSLFNICQETWTGRKGPVFLEFCLDISAAPASAELELNFKGGVNSSQPIYDVDQSAIKAVVEHLKAAKRPLILIGGEFPRDMADLLEGFKKWGIPIATTFNGADRIGSEYKFFAGRPNWYGSRWSNLILQQADLLITIGSRLGLLQVGYNWEEFAPLATKVHVYLDRDELEKSFLKSDIQIHSSSQLFVEKLLKELFNISFMPDLSEWQDLVAIIRKDLAIPDKSNKCEEQYLELHYFIYNLFNQLKSGDVIVPCSSGGTYTGTMQIMMNKSGQKIVTSNALASMGVGLSGAIGAAIANPDSRTILLEGDGGFAQNMQELGTVKANRCNLKVFISDNRGYASIRTTQKTYFENHYVGCDEETGLGLPDWQKVGEAYEIPTFLVTPSSAFNQDFLKLLETTGPAIFVLKLDPDQLYFPKLGSRIAKDGKMKSAPLHKMDPQLTAQEEQKYMPYLRE